MHKHVVIWGAGKIGRGFIAELFDNAGYRIVFIDADADLAESLRERGSYSVVKLPEGQPESERKISGYEVVAVAERAALARHLRDATLAAVAVFPPVFDAVAAELAPELERRATEEPDATLDIVLCANSAHPAERFSELLTGKLTEAARRYLKRRVGLVESVILRIGIDADGKRRERDPNVVVTNGYPELIADGTAFKGPVPDIPGLRLSERIGEEEYRKIYCYNMAHAALAYAGYRKGYRYIAEAADDPEIASHVSGALSEVARGLAAEYSFTEAEMSAYCSGIIGYLGNRALQDTVLRVGADPKRKLSPADRLIGPARICARHGIEPRRLLRAVAHAFRFDPPEDAAARELQEQQKLHGLSYCLERYCGIAAEDPLYAIAMEELNAR